MDLHALLTYTIQTGPIRVVVWEVLYVIILVNVLAAILDRFLFRPVVHVLDERKRRLEGAASETARLVGVLDARLRGHADSLASARRDALGVVDEARREADAERRTKLDEARKTAEGRVVIAKEAIDKATRKANNDLKLEVMERLGRKIASAVLGREVA